MTIDQTEQYKYLGETFNSNNNMSTNHIQEIERKTEAALQTTLFIAGVDNFKGIQMDTIWTILETCIIPIITHGSETWDLNKTEKKKLNKILDNLIKRILAIPQTTPRECIYEELQIMDIEHRITERCLNYYKGMTSRKKHIDKRNTRQQPPQILESTNNTNPQRLKHQRGTIPESNKKTNKSNDNNENKKENGRNPRQRREKQIQTPIPERQPKQKQEDKDNLPKDTKQTRSQSNIHGVTRDRRDEHCNVDGGEISIKNRAARNLSAR